ncbi:MAG: TM2 domain-containing protein [Clostridia bacterium]|nr:TM2 domain-containing protein [Clostridia bacterium]
MFCKNCGKEMNDNQAICLNCGVKTGEGKAFCENCGNALPENAAVCLNCGVAVNNAPVVDPSIQKSKLVAGLLGIFLGSIGVHNFYLGYTGKAVAQLLISILTCGAGAAVTGIWGVIEGIMLLCGKIDKDGKGNPLKD